MKKRKPAAPHPFSDPNKDFQDSASSQLLANICAKEYQDLNASDYCVLFQPYCPPGEVSELFPYVSPLFSYIKNYLSDHPSSASLSVWENFLDWLEIHQKEIANINKTDFIEREIKNLFSFLREYKWKQEMAYGIICSIAGIMEYYACKYIEGPRGIDALGNIMKMFLANEIKTRLILLELYLSAYKDAENKKHILDIYSKHSMMKLKTN